VLPSVLRGKSNAPITLPRLTGQPLHEQAKITAMGNILWANSETPSLGEYRLVGVDFQCSTSDQYPKYRHAVYNRTKEAPEGACLGRLWVAGG
jgi:hypothetical protein